MSTTIHNFLSVSIGFFWNKLKTSSSSISAFISLGVVHSSLAFSIASFSISAYATFNDMTADFRHPI